MSRGANRIVVRAQIVVQTAFRIGSGSVSTVSELPVLRDDEGNLIVEGTSLAGVLRATLTREGRLLDFSHGSSAPIPGEAAVDDLFGTGPPSGAAGRASRIQIASAAVAAPNATAIRDHVGIDRERSASREQVKFENEVVAAGALFELRLIVHDPTPVDRALLLLIERRIREGWVTLGSQSGSGMGRLSIGDDGWKAWELDLSDPKTLAGFLARTDAFWTPDSRHAPLSRAATVSVKPAGPTSAIHPYEVPNRLAITVRISVRDLLLVKDGLRDRFRLEDFKVNERAEGGGQTIDHSPVTEPGLAGATDVVSASRGFDQIKALGLDQIFIPGSSFRGTMRSRAEKILRTLALGDALTVDPAKERTAMAACDPFDTDLASPYVSCGSRMQRRLKSDLKEGTAEHYEQAYSHVCLACRLFGSTHLRGRIAIEDLRPLSGSGFTLKILDHVAIDRFTGGALDQKKFNAVAIASGTFEGRIRVQGFESWQLGLVALLLKDLWLEDLPLGSGTNRGYGRVQGEPVAVDLECLTDRDPIPDVVDSLLDPRQIEWDDDPDLLPWKRLRWSRDSSGDDVWTRWAPVVGRFVADLDAQAKGFAVPAAMLQQAGTGARGPEVLR